MNDPTGNPRRLFDMEIDEISLVDRGANQHASIVFSKALRNEEDTMGEDDLYDEFGNIVEEVEIGDLVYDAEGNEYVVDVDDDVDDDDYYEEDFYEDDIYDGEYAEVGKGYGSKALKLFQSGARAGGGNLEELKGYHKLSPKQQKVWNAGAYAGGAVGNTRKKLGVGNPNPWAVGTAAGLTGAALGGGTVYAHNRMQKSLGDVVMEELSKAASEEERNEIVASAMEEVEVAKADAAEAWNRVADQDDAMLADAYIAKAAEFNLPVDPVNFGLILKSMGEVLDYDQLEEMEQLFAGMGEVLYEELGYEGDTDNVSVMDVVDSYANEYIGKSGEVSQEMMSTAIFDMNPDAYDAYLAERNGI